MMCFKPTTAEALSQVSVRKSRQAMVSCNIAVLFGNGFSRCEQSAKSIKGQADAFYALVSAHDMMLLQSYIDSIGSIKDWRLIFASVFHHYASSLGRVR